ncbi:MAG: hypothetical protein AAF598_21365 [Bacteroidota bacterium]
MNTKFLLAGWLLLSAVCSKAQGLSLRFSKATSGCIEQIWSQLNSDRTDLCYTIKDQGQVLQVTQSKGEWFLLILEDEDDGLIYMKRVQHPSTRFDLTQLKRTIANIRILDARGREQFRFERCMTNTLAMVK